MNKTLEILLLSDSIIFTTFGLFSPIFAIFINNEIIGGSIFTAGLASTLYLALKSAVQLPLGKYVDKHDHKIKLLLLGTGLFVIGPLIYIFADNIIWILIAQIIDGAAAGLAYPTWMGLWTLNLDKKKESYEWSVYSTIISIGSAIAGTIGAALIQLFSFKSIFVLVAVCYFIGFLVLFWLEKSAEHDRQRTLMFARKNRH